MQRCRRRHLPGRRGRGPRGRECRRVRPHRHLSRHRYGGQRHRADLRLCRGGVDITAGGGVSICGTEAQTSFAAPATQAYGNAGNDTLRGEAGKMSSTEAPATHLLWQRRRLILRSTPATSRSGMPARAPIVDISTPPTVGDNIRSSTVLPGASTAPPAARRRCLQLCVPAADRRQRQRPDPRRSSSGVLAGSEATTACGAATATAPTAGWAATPSTAAPATYSGLLRPTAARRSTSPPAATGGDIRSPASERAGGFGRRFLTGSASASAAQRRRHRHPDRQ